MDWHGVDLNLLPVFDALMRTGSVTRAGRELGLSQPAMSYALKRLRAQSGDPLLVRSGRTMLPTARAAALAEPVRDVLDNIRQRILAGAGFDPASAEREFSLCLTDVGALVFLPRLLKRLNAVAPGCTLRSRQVPVDELAGELESGGIDLAIGYYPDLPGSVVQQRLYERDYVCLVRAGHPLARGKFTLARYCAADHVVVRSPVRVQESVDRTLARRGLRRRVVLSVPHYIVIPPLLEDSDLIATLPSEVATAFARFADLRQLPAPVAVPKVVLRAHWHQRAHHDAAHRWLRSQVLELFAETSNRSRALTNRA